MIRLLFALLTVNVLVLVTQIDGEIAFESTVAVNAAATVAIS